MNALLLQCHHTQWCLNRQAYYYFRWQLSTGLLVWAIDIFHNIYEEKIQKQISFLRFPGFERRFHNFPWCSMHSIQGKSPCEIGGKAQEMALLCGQIRRKFCTLHTVNFHLHFIKEQTWSENRVAFLSLWFIFLVLFIQWESSSQKCFSLSLLDYFLYWRTQLIGTTASSLVIQKDQLRCRSSEIRLRFAFYFTLFPLQYQKNFRETLGHKMNRSRIWARDSAVSALFSSLRPLFISETTRWFERHTLRKVCIFLLFQYWSRHLRRRLCRSATSAIAESHQDIHWRWRCRITNLL